MAKNPAAYSVNDRIHHAVFGLGTISQMNSRHTTITFDENGTRKFIAEMLRFERSDVPAPAKPVRRKKVKTAK